MPDRKADMWDARLIKAYYLNKHYQVNGFPIWYEESPDVLFKAKKRVIKSIEVVERATSNYQKATQDSPQYGVSFYAIPIIRSGATRPTRDEWIQKQVEKRKNPDGGFAEDALQDDLKRAELVRRSEERAVAKLGGSLLNDDKIENDSL